MTIDEFIAEIRALAQDEGRRAGARFWSLATWEERFANGLTPREAWDLETCPGLRAL